MADSEPPQLNPEGNAKKPIVSAFENTRERISAYISYQSLKIKEYFGKLNEDEFHKLLSIEFQDELRDNPPIKEVFSAESDLKRIAGLPKDQKREALDTFKDNLARQRIALAACRVFIERSIEFNHDVSVDKLAAIVDKFSENYSFEPKQIEIAQNLIELYYSNRKKVLEVRKKYPDDHELVNKLTSQNFGKEEDFDISIGPMSVDIATNSFNSGRIFERANIPVVGFQYGGFADESRGTDPIFYVVINKDSLDLLTTEVIKKHEYEHQKNKLFRAIFNTKNMPSSLSSYEDEKDSEIKKIVLEDYMDQQRIFALDKVRDEITAYVLSSDLTTVQNNLSDLFFEQQGSYDYLSNVRDSVKFKNDVMYQETSQRMLVQEYQDTIKSSVSSFSKLVNIGQYSIQEAIALLTDKPLEQWPKTVKRLLEQKELA